MSEDQAKFETYMDNHMHVLMAVKKMPTVEAFSAYCRRVVIGRQVQVVANNIDWPYMARKYAGIRPKGAT